MERISGPHQGFYIASYACDAGADDGSFLGYAKICRRRPGSYWDANCLLKLSGKAFHADGERALAEAEAHAQQHLALLLAGTPEAAA